MQHPLVSCLSPREDPSPSATTTWMTEAPSSPSVKQFRKTLYFQENEIKVCSFSALQLSVQVGDADTISNPSITHKTF